MRSRKRRNSGLERVEGRVATWQGEFVRESKLRIRREGD